MHKNIMFYALICINNHVITSINYMLLGIPMIGNLMLTPRSLLGH